MLIKQVPDPEFGVWHLLYQSYVPDPEFPFVPLVLLVVTSLVSNYRIIRSCRRFRYSRLSRA